MPPSLADLWIAIDQRQAKTGCSLRDATLYIVDNPPSGSTRQAVVHAVGIRLYGRKAWPVDPYSRIVQIFDQQGGPHVLVRSMFDCCGHYIEKDALGYIQTYIQRMKLGKTHAKKGV